MKIVFVLTFNFLLYNLLQLDYSLHNILKNPFQSAISSHDINDTLSFDQQLKIFKDFGYNLNPEISKEMIFSDLKYNDNTDAFIESEFKKNQFELLYFYLGWKPEGKSYYATNNCIWYSIYRIDPSSEYIEFMKKMGEISDGELIFTEIAIRIDANNYEWIDFKINGLFKSWQLEKVGFIDDSFFQRFSYLPKEFKTKGKYTYFDSGNLDFVIDYATEEEQTEFIKLTGLRREWLGDGNHFRDPVSKF